MQPQEYKMFTGNYWKYGLALGAGVLVGAVAAVLLSRNNVDLKGAAASLISRGMDLKDKAAEIVETAKENMDDLAAEARHAQASRKAGEARKVEGA
jgi:hypothetical protein